MDTRSQPAPHVPLRHLGAVAGQFLSSLHCTHTRSRQKGNVIGHCASSAHCTQRPSRQIPVGAAQSVLLVQATQSPDAVLQNGVGAAHPAFDVQPRRHSLSPLQIGVAEGQFALVRHCTQRPLAPTQKGAAAPHCALLTQATHCLVVGLQIGRGVPAQSMSPLQPTHWPVMVSHLLASPLHEVGVHAGRHT